VESVLRKQPSSEAATGSSNNRKAPAAGSINFLRSADRDGPNADRDVPCRPVPRRISSSRSFGSAVDGCRLIPFRHNVGAHMTTLEHRFSAHFITRLVAKWICGQTGSLLADTNNINSPRRERDNPDPRPFRVRNHRLQHAGWFEHVHHSARWRSGSPPLLGPDCVHFSKSLTGWRLRRWAEITAGRRRSLVSMSRQFR